MAFDVLGSCEHGTACSPWRFQEDSGGDRSPYSRTDRVSRPPHEPLPPESSLSTPLRPGARPVSGAVLRHEMHTQSRDVQVSVATSCSRGSGPQRGWVVCWVTRASRVAAFACVLSVNVTTGGRLGPDVRAAVPVGGSVLEGTAGVGALRGCRW